MECKELILLLLLSVPQVLAIPDLIVQVNTVRWSQIVSERFLSLSIDPLALIIAGKLSPSTKFMAKSLSPIFVRIGGPNTENIRFGHSSASNGNISITEAEWISVNKFAREANLDLVLCLRAMRRTQSVWDSANALEIISSSHRHGFTDIWQMGWDMSEMRGISGAELGRDIVRLKKILDAFPGYENAPILAPGLSCCLNNFQARFIKDLLQESSSAVSALPVHLNFSGISLDKIGDKIGTTLIQMEEQIWGKDLLLRASVPRKPIWISELDPNGGGFKDAMNWIVKLGSAARYGVQVMMRQPHMLSFHSPTHDYWASLLYKNLVGRYVFESRVLSGNRSSTFMYSHCTAPTDDRTSILASKFGYEKGALTLFGVNPYSEGLKIQVRGLSMKEELVHLYILTEEINFYKDSKWHPTQTLYNGQKLMLSSKGELPLLAPKVRKIGRGQSISVPAHSIFFIVYPDVKVRMCMSNPFGNDDFQDLSKKLMVPHSRSEDVAESWEDNNAERTYVSFSKRVPTPHKHHEDLKTKLLKDLHKVAGKLGLEKEQHDPQLENVKYNFYNDQTWLGRLADGLNKDNVRDRENVNVRQERTDPDSEMARLEKYALLTSAIYGKDSNGSSLLRVSNLNGAGDPNYSHFRYTRSVKQNNDKSTTDNKSELSNIDSSNNQRININKLNETDNNTKLHSFIIGLLKKSGYNTTNYTAQQHLVHGFVNNLKEVDVSVGSLDSEKDTNTAESVSPAEEAIQHKIKKREEEGLDHKQTALGPRADDKSVISREKQDGSEIKSSTTDQTSNIKTSNLEGIEEKEFNKIIDENIKEGAAFEVAPKPDVQSNNQSELNSEKQSGLSSNLEKTIPNNSSENDDKMKADDEGALKDEHSTGEHLVSSRDVNSDDNPDEVKLNVLEVEPIPPQDDDGLNRETGGISGDQPPDSGLLKEPIKLKKISEIIDEIKAKGFKDLVPPSSFKGITLEERIQKLEDIKSRVVDIKAKIKEELSKAREKLAQSMGSIANVVPSDNNQPSKRNIYEMPDKLAGLLERMNFNLMNNIKPRHSRSPILTDEEIDSILEREIAETANEFYKEQLSSLIDGDYNTQIDPSDYIVLPAIEAEKESLPTKIYKVLKGRGLDSNEISDENPNLKNVYFKERLHDLNFNDKANLKNSYKLINHRNFDNYDQQAEELENLRSLLEENNYGLSRSQIFDPNFTEFRKQAIRNKLQQSMLQSKKIKNSNLFNDRNNDIPVILYPKNIFSHSRYPRSVRYDEMMPPVSKEIARQKREVRSREMDNRIVKHKPAEGLETDVFKLRVDNKFKDKDVSLYELAEEYTKLKNQNDRSASFKDFDQRQEDNRITFSDDNFYENFPPLMENLNTDTILNGANKIIEDNAKNLTQEISNIKSDKINDLINSEDAQNELTLKNADKTENNMDYSDINYPEDWMDHAERVSPPCTKTKLKKQKHNPQRSQSPISHFISKIKHLIKFISEFRLSDYLKGKKRADDQQ